jgi:hypothetical protein
MDLRGGPAAGIEPGSAVLSRSVAIANFPVLARFLGGAALLLLLVLGGAVPPAQAIEHYTDAQGTIHIKNDPSKSKKGSEAAKPAAPQPPPSVLRRPGPRGANPPPEKPNVSASGTPPPPHLHHPVPPGAPPGAPPAATGPRFGSHQLRREPPPAPPAAAPGLPSPPGPPGGE